MHTPTYAASSDVSTEMHHTLTYADVCVICSGRGFAKLLRPHVCLPMHHTLTYTYVCVICGGRGLDGLREDALDFADPLNNREIHILVAHLYDHAAQQRFVHLCVCVCVDYLQASPSEYIYIHKYIYMRVIVCVCVCVCLDLLLDDEGGTLLLLRQGAYNYISSAK